MPDFNELEFSDFSKNSEVLNFMKIRPVGAELFHADGRTDMTKLLVAFRNFANASKNLPSFLFCRTHELCIKPPEGQTRSSLRQWLLFLSASQHMEVKL